MLPASMFAPGSALPIAGLLVAGIIVYQQASAVWAGFRAARWPRVEGRVLEASVTGLPIAPLRRAPRAAVPIIEYEYSVDGQRYRNNRVSFGSFTVSEAIATTAFYKRAKHVQVAYDPRRPERAVLETGPDVRALLYAAIGGVGLYLSAHALLAAP
jgi:hypothetical protein